MTQRILILVAACGLVLSACRPREALPSAAPSATAQSETNRAIVLQACEDVFGTPVDPENGFFEVDRYFVLEVQFDDNGRLDQLGIFPKHYFGDTHPEWDETEDVGELTEAQYEDLLRRLDSVHPKGALVERDELPVVKEMTMRHRDVYENAVVVTGDVVDDTRPEDAPRAIKYFIVSPSP